MRLIVDIGNTKTKVAAFQGGKIVFAQELISGIDKETQEKIELLKPALGIISNVSSATNVWIETFPDVNWLELNRQMTLPIALDYETPDTLGLDRIALASAAAVLYPQKNVLAIDAGTCVTFDLVRKDGRYVGGAISPGLHMRLKAMHAFTAKLPLVQINPQVELVGKSTESCMQSGSLHGLAAEVDGVINRYYEQFEDLHVVLTGGDTNVLAPLIKNNIFAHPNFLLEGLHAILAVNTP